MTSENDSVASKAMTSASPTEPTDTETSNLKPSKPKQPSANTKPVTPFLGICIVVGVLSLYAWLIAIIASLAQSIQSGKPDSIIWTLQFPFVLPIVSTKLIWHSIISIPNNSLLNWESGAQSNSIKTNKPKSTPVITTKPDSTEPTMSWFQKSLTLQSRSRGSYLITEEIESQLPEIKNYKVGILNLFLQHTSAALSLNENWDSEVREDMSDALDRIAPEDKKGNMYRHSAEGLDDMPAHIKSALIGASVSVPITNGRLNTGTWQGIWYLEFRRSKHSRNVVATIQGEKM